jgi:hypothetical protein
VEGYNVLSKVVEGGWDGIDAAFGPWAVLACSCCKPLPLSVDVLPLSFGVLVNFLSPHDGFLFLSEHFYSCCTLMNFSYSAAASSSSTSSSQSCTWI